MVIRHLFQKFEKCNLWKLHQFLYLVIQGRTSILARENELLKHQLKKYVGAVQKLRDGPQVCQLVIWVPSLCQAYETLAQLEGKKTEEGSHSKYIDYHFEAGEYEKKLIQVSVRWW